MYIQYFATIEIMQLSHTMPGKCRTAKLDTRTDTSSSMTQDLSLRLHMTPRTRLNLRVLGLGKQKKELFLKLRKQ